MRCEQHSKLRAAGRRDDRRAGWRRSADRTRLRPNSLQTGNFSGNLRNLELRGQPISTENTVIAALL